MTKTIVKRRRNGNRRGPLWRPGFEPLEGRALMTLGGSDRLLIQLLPGVEAAALAGHGAGVSLQATAVPGLMRATGDAGALDRLSAALSGHEGVGYVEPESMVHIDAAPNDPFFANNSMWGLNGQYGIDAPAAWDVTTGSTLVTVADIDTGVDYNHPDLYKNIWINQGEIPASRRGNLVDLDGDGRITFYDLNDPANQGMGKITDINADGRIDGGDILAPMQTDSGGIDTGLGGWSDGVSQDGDRRTWTTSSGGTSSTTRTIRSTTTATARTSRAPSRRWATTPSASSA